MPIVKKLEPVVFPIEEFRYDTLMELLSGNVDDKSFIIVPISNEKIPTGSYLVCRIEAKG